MARRSLRILHASDLHLDEPFEGISLVPDHLLDLFLRARRSAAERLFQVAIEDEVDAVILAGHILRVPDADAGSLEFLQHQLAGLESAGITTYWCDTPHDEVSRWPSGVALPPSVQLITESQPRTRLLRRGSEILAAVVGVAGNANGRIPLDQLQGEASRFTIGVAHGRLENQSWLPIGLDYGAFGGDHQPESNPTAAMSPSGSPQGAAPDEVGPHGCLIVEIEPNGHIHRQFVPTDVVRWSEEVLELPDDFDQAGLLRMMRERTLRLAESSGNRQVLVQWRLRDGDQKRDTGSDLLAAHLRQGGMDAEILNALRAEFGAACPGVWTLGIDVEPPAQLPEAWYEEDTVLGDLLRCIQQYQSDATLSLDAVQSLVEPQLPAAVAEYLKETPLADRQRLLRSVAVLGVDLLRGDRVLSEEWFRA